MAAFRLSSWLIRNRTRITTVAVALIVTGSAARAQELRGTVRDSATGRPLASAVVNAFAAPDQPLGRTITNERGEYRLTGTVAIQRIRVVRLGFRPRDLPVPAGTTTRDVIMVQIPPLLERVRVTASNSCPRRKDTDDAMALLEQARAGLLATVVAREAKPAAMKLIRYQRQMDGLSDRTETQRITISLNDARTTSFESPTSSARLVKDGFILGNGALVIGPDADVLLSEEFASAYCFRIDDAPKERANQVGLGFFRADGERGGRVDIEGALWIDTVSHTLRDIDFRFVGRSVGAGAPDSRGFVVFQEMPNGVVFVERWGLRIINGFTMMPPPGRGMSAPGPRFSARESGGETAAATWADSTKWQAPLASLQVHVVHANRLPALGIAVGLAGTDYAASVDSAGNVRIEDILPGEYSAVVSDTYGSKMETKLHFTATRGRLITDTVTVPTAAEFGRAYCETRKAGNWMTLHVVNQDGTPASTLPWEISTRHATDSLKTKVAASGVTPADGVVAMCDGFLTRFQGAQFFLLDADGTKQLLAYPLAEGTGDVVVKVP